MSGRPANPLSALGEIMQLAFVPADIHAALRFWTERMGVGPFFRLPIRSVPGLRYRGRPSAPEFTICLAHWGSLQIELIEQHNDAPSIYREWRSAGHEGLHHTCIVVESIAHARNTVLAAGLEIAQEWDFPKGGVIYVDTGGGPGTMIELIEPMQATLDRFEMIKAASQNWNGVAPLRDFPA